MIELIKQLIEQDGLANKNRKREIINRKIYLYNVLRKDGLTLQKIGSMFNAHHATIFHGLKTYENLMQTSDKQLKFDTEYYELLISLNKPLVDIRKEIKEAKNLTDLRRIQERITNKFY